jgi:toxin YoeB
MKGVGKPEPLKFIQAYSRRIDEKNRLDYQVTNTDLVILSCIGHYEDERYRSKKKVIFSKMTFFV